MINLIRKIIKPKYETLNHIEIDAKNIISNFNYLQKIQPTAEIFPVLKANAYGHGLKEICLILNKTKAKMVAVDSYPEAQIAYRYFRGKVLILSEMPLRAYSYTKLSKTEFMVYNESTLKYLTRFGKKAKVHLFINSGMNREGIQNLGEFINNNIEELKKVTINGLASHLASADNRSALNEEQEQKFIKDLEVLNKNGFYPPWVHLGNSAAIFWLDNPIITAFRPGLALYGYHPSPENDENNNLKPALEIFSQITSLQNVKKDESVSYNETFVAETDTLIGTIPFGYYEGLDRRFSNQAQFLINNENESFFAKIAGRVCMNIACLDLGENKVEIGDEVKIISKKTEDPNSLSSLADLSDTIIYEILTKIQANIRRIIINHDK